LQFKIGAKALVDEADAHPLTAAPSTPDRSMTEIADKSKRKRWPCVAATVLLVLLLVAGGIWWRSTGPIDPRLVGRWDLIDSGSSVNNGRFILGESGRGEMFDPSGVRTTGFNWYVRGDHLVLEPDRPFLDRVMDVGRRVYGFFRPQGPPADPEFRMTNVTPSRVDLAATAGGLSAYPMALIRVSEAQASTALPSAP
jgi:hypothetical protein